MSTTNTRRLIVVLGIGVLAAAFFGMKYMQTAKKPPRQVATATPAPIAETFPAQNGSVASQLDVQGELKAFKKIDIFSGVSGTLESTAKPFKVGSYFPKGSVLISVDDTEAQLNLLAQKSSLLNAITQLMPDLKIDYPESFQQWKSYLDDFDVEEPVKAFPKALNDQEKYFIASKNILNQFYTIKSAEERLSKYTVSSPFSGVITQTSINPGALVRTGQKLGELMNTANFELEVTVPLSDLQYLSKGSQVQLYSRDTDDNWTGRVKRINDQVDPGTQTVLVFIGVNGKNLREGMYMNGSVETSDIQNAIAIPRNLLVNQNAVFLVEGQKLHLEEVEVVRITEEVAIVRGLKDGAAILKNKIPGAFEGMEIKLSNGNVSNQESASSANAALGGS